MTSVVIRSLSLDDADVALGRLLVHEYVVATADETGMDPSVVADLVPDLHDFPARYLEGGAYLVAETGADVAGGVGVTPLDGGQCEMNRLWVRSPFRRTRTGRRLAEASIATARTLGFTRMVLDVVPSRTGAIALYRSLGFLEIEPFHDYGFPMVAFARAL